MKKTLSLALALVLCLGLVLPACAAEAAANAGDTTVTDKNGNVYTLSNPVLYTVPCSDVNGLPSKGEFDVLYAVPVNTVVTPPENAFIGNFEWTDVLWKDNRCSLSPVGANGDLWDWFELDVSGAILVLGCYDGIDKTVPKTSGGGDEGSGTDGSYAGGFLGSRLGTIAFFVPEAEHYAASPFAAPPETPDTSETPSKTAFTDVAAGAYYEDAVAWAVSEGITSGTTASTFSPNETCTIFQILTFLWRANGSPEPTIQNPFPNIKETAYFYKPLLWAVEQKLVGSDTYEDGWPCTRGLTVFFMWKVSGAEFDQGAFEKQLFDDVPLEDSNTFVQPVYWALKNGVTSGTSATTFSPEATCTRGQIVTFLYRAYK